MFELTLLTSAATRHKKCEQTLTIVNVSHESKAILSLKGILQLCQNWFPRTALSANRSLLAPSKMYLVSKYKSFFEHFQIRTAETMPKNLWANIFRGRDIFLQECWQYQRWRNYRSTICSLLLQQMAFRAVTVSCCVISENKTNAKIYPKNQCV